MRVQPLKRKANTIARYSVDSCGVILYNITIARYSDAERSANGIR